MLKLIVPLLFLCLNVTFAQNTHVLYGERDLNNTAPAIFFDREGSIYPNYFISDSTLQQCNSSLKEWYSKHEHDFIKIARTLNCTFNTFSLKNYETLNDSIISSFTKKMRNQSGALQSATFIIHGFRKPFFNNNRDRSSSKNFKVVEDIIDSHSNSKTCYVEVYWDAMYGCCFSASSKKNKVLFKLFEEAQINAAHVGERFKKVLLQTKFDTITILTHSLGAKVAAYALLNINNNNNLTPSHKKINICLIAPAISPQLITDNYYKRNTSVDFTKRDNYHLSIVYNENDFVLKKKDNKLGLFGPGPYKYGNTTLGCNYNKAAMNLKKEFDKNYINSSIALFDLSSVGKCHHITCYCKDDNFWKVVNYINY